MCRGSRRWRWGGVSLQEGSHIDWEEWARDHSRRRSYIFLFIFLHESEICKRQFLHESEICGVAKINNPTHISK